MNHGILGEMLKEEVTSESVLKSLDTDEDNQSAEESDSTMCLPESKNVLDKNDVSHYLKSKTVPTILRTKRLRETDTSYDNETELKEEINFLVNSEKCADYVRNTLSVLKGSCNSLLVNNKVTVLEGPIFNQHNNLFRNINEYVTQQSMEMNSSYRNSPISEDHTCEVQPCNENDFESNRNFIDSENPITVKGETVELECGDDILFTNGDSYCNDSVLTTKTELVEMECGDDILFTTDAANYHNEDPVTTTQVESATESFELECGDDILYTDGAGYYNSDQDSTEENENFNYNYEDEHKLSDQIKQEIDIKNSDSFEEHEDELHHIKSEFPYENGFVICEKCGIPFGNLSLLQQHQFETCGLKYFYTCKFCPSTSWYSSTLKKHIEVVHSRELDKENIDDIMENIKQSKQVERDPSDDLSIKDNEKTEQFDDKQTSKTSIPHKKTSKKTKSKRGKKKRCKYIYYRDIKEILKISCFDCHVHPEYQNGRTEQHCTICNNEFTYQCVRCGKFYFQYTTAKLHAKRDCKKSKLAKIHTVNNQLTKTQDKSANTLPNKSISGGSKHVKPICASCHEPMERKGVKYDKICRNCNRTLLLKYHCEVCKQRFNVKSTACRHALACHRQWRDFLINSSLSTLALLDHNYYCKNISEPEINKIEKMQQPQFIEITLSTDQSTRRVYSEKKSRSFHS